MSKETVEIEKGLFLESICKWFDSLSLSIADSDSFTNVRIVPVPGFAADFANPESGKASYQNYKKVLSVFGVYCMDVYVGQCWAVAPKWENGGQVATSLNSTSSA